MPFAYFTPETTLPLASALATAVGFLLVIARVPGRFAGQGVRRGLDAWRAYRGRRGGTGPRG